ncbi:MAG: AAA family ATPase [Gemmatimonadota bacterium]
MVGTARLASLPELTGSNRNRPFQFLTMRTESSPETSPAVTPLRFEVFGGPKLSGPDERGVRLSALQGALLTLLAAYGRKGASRARLVNLLWEEGDESTLRHRLGQALYELRRKLAAPDLTIYENDRYQLNPEVISTDLEDLNRLLTEKRLKEAAILVTQGVLPNLDQAPTEAFHEWARGREARWRGEVRTGAAVMWEKSAEQANWTATDDPSEALLILAPEDPMVIERRLRSLGSTGRLAEARALVASHQEEFARLHPNTPHSSDLTSLVELLHKAEGLSRIATKELAHSTKLLGRDRELGELLAAVRNARVASPRTVLVVGRRGVGKSRLAREALTVFMGSDHILIPLRCSPLEQGSPLSPILEGIASMRARSVLENVPSRWRAILNKLCAEPDIRTGGRAHEPSVRRDADWNEIRALRALFEAMSGGRPTTVLVDDIEWGDASTIRFLQHIGEAWEGGPLLRLFTLSEDSLKPNSLLARSLAESSLRSAKRIHLLPLSDGDLDRLVEEWYRELRGDLHPPGLPRPLVDIVRLAGGDLHIVRSMIEEWLDHSPADSPTNRSRVLSATLKRSLSGLDDATRRLAEAAAVCGDPIPPTLIQEVLSLDETTVIDGLETLVLRGFLRWDEGQLILTNGTIQHHLLECTATARRHFLHLRLARAFLNDHGARAPARAAHHFARAGLRSVAAPMALRVAEATRDRGEVTEAIAILEAALHPIESLPSDAVDAAIALGRCLLLSGQLAEAGDWFSRAAAAAISNGDSQREFKARVGAIEASALASAPADRGPLHLVRSIRSEFQATGYFEELPKTIELELRLLAKAGDHGGVQAVLHQCEELLLQVDGPVARSLRSLLTLGTLYGKPLPEASVMDGVLQAAEATDDHDLALRALNWQVIIGIQRGTLNRPEGVSIRRRALGAALKSGDFFERVKLRMNLAVWYLDSGDLDGAMVALDRATNVLGDLPFPKARLNLLVNQGALALDQRNFTLAAERFRMAREISAGAVSHPAYLSGTAGLCLAHLGMGSLREAQGLSADLASLHRWHPFDVSLVARAACHVALVTKGKQPAVAMLQEASGQLKGRFNLGWARVNIERVKITRRLDPEAEEVLAFARSEGLSFVQSGMEALLKP